ncbi:MAG: 1,4-alpha-glucan branching protein GlgB [Anaerococcus sp.]|uniref:1,4-alpha-glucan branching protein GlgB n=1 Tax=Anaerococcus sp. TaxID=1872515 RepID=UPI0026295B9B|nr:1,4-alpha-glucan branching protein GlgB [Anaerococcus sp.]MCI5971681.1 1,4-alpha-glucan branching protein GlgB [Anaerococcus sp.]MDD6918667.1 1,4-alpha-glucan branching protein GlgB [Peptoniphilaceae bacterium]MDY2928659.1 1,4-alpha-glucan branching protein GlgB [Anaerococcus sp.]
MKVNITETPHDHIENYLAGHSSMGADIWGAHKDTDGKYVFRVLAPNADEVYIKGDFTSWENTKMTKNTKYGYFFIKLDAKPGDYYKYIVVHEGNWVEKTDPFARAMDKEGDFASIITDDSYDFSDEDFIKNRDKNFDKPLNIYEIHIGSWLRYNDNVNFLDIVDKLVAYVKEMNYTHVEIMPITEYPYYPSWGYQSSGFFATSSRFGSPVDLKKFVDILHQNGIGVILDMVAVHFASDYFGLDHFDGTGMYESIYPDLKYSEWGSNNFDYSKGHVRSFMKSAMTYWLENFHFDGIRIDAVSYMIHYNGNKNRGVHRDNIEFIKDLNKTIHEAFPNVMLIAEDSSDFPQVTGKVEDGGLGFDYKWDLGWMNDTLRYFKTDSINRINHQANINFSMFYFYNERFILPLSHDEVVHMKGAMINKMAGSYEEKFKQLKLLYTYQMTHPGKKLNFMGNEIATFDEWNEHESINWDILKFPTHDDIHRYVKDLNTLYKESPAFFEKDYEEDGFSWKVVDDNINSVFAYERKAGDDRYLVVLNMTNTYKGAFEIPYDEDLEFVEVLDSLSETYGGSRWDKRKIKIEKGNNLVLELWEYEAIVLKVK